MEPDGVKTMSSYERTQCLKTLIRIEEDLRFCETAVTSGSRLELAHETLIALADELEVLRNRALKPMDRIRLEKDHHLTKVLLYHAKDRLEAQYRDQEKFLSHSRR